MFDAVDPPPGFVLDVGRDGSRHTIALLREVDSGDDEAPGWEVIGELMWHATSSPPGTPAHFRGFFDSDPDADGHGDDPIWDYPHVRGEVSYLEVAPTWRRQGVASMLWRAARRLVEHCPPVHSPDRTREGDAWARAVGGDLPAWERCSLLDGVDLRG